MMKWHYFWHWATNNIDVVLVDGADEMEGVAGSQYLANLAIFLAATYRTNIGTRQHSFRPFRSISAGSQGCTSPGGQH